MLHTAKHIISYYFVRDKLWQIHKDWFQEILKTFFRLLDWGLKKWLMGKLLHKCSSFSNFRSDTFYWCFFKNEALQSINLVRKQVVCDTLISMFLCFFSTQKSYFRRHTTRNEGACIINRQRDHSCLKKKHQIIKHRDQKVLRPILNKRTILFS